MSSGKVYRGVSDQEDLPDKWTNNNFLEITKTQLFSFLMNCDQQDLITILYIIIVQFILSK